MLGSGVEWWCVMSACQMCKIKPCQCFVREASIDKAAKEAYEKARQSNWIDWECIDWRTRKYWRSVVVRNVQAAKGAES